MTAASLAERVAARRVASVDLVALVLSALAAPFVVVGWLAGALVTAVLWVCAAVALGFDWGRGRRGDPS